MNRLGSRISLALVAIWLTGCVLVRPPRSEYRPVHQHAQDCDLTSLAGDISSNRCVIDLPSDSGRTPLHIATANCCTDAISFLLEHHAKVNAKANEGETPLHVAAQEGCNDAVILLLNAGAKIDARDKQGRTPLRRAEEWNQDATSALLKQKGAAE